MNEVDIHVEAEPHVLYELQDYFSFDVDGASFSPAYRNRQWNGKIYLFSVNTKRIHGGLVYRLCKFLDKHGYDWEFENNKFYGAPYEIDESVSLLGVENFMKNCSDKEPRNYQVEAVYTALKEYRKTIVSPTGCHPLGTKVIMSDGSTKNVEDVIVGDKLLGTNGETRNVLKLCRGTGKIYNIISSSNKSNRFESFRVNGDHILSLVNTTTNQIVNISVNEYLLKSNWYKHTHKLYKNNYELNFHNDNVTGNIHPYFMGVYLGDGSKHNTQITTIDPEIKEYCNNFIGNYYPELKVTIHTKSSTEAVSMSFVRKCTIGSKNNRLTSDLRSSGFEHKNISCGNKFIPVHYKTGSVEDRYELLAGLIDTDGSLECGSYYSYCSKSLTLCSDVSFIARSLGFSSTMMSKFINGVEYYTCSIYGDGVEKIPVKIDRKKITKLLKRNKIASRFGFIIEESEEENYYGFQLDGNNLYFLDNFIITHNSGKSLCIYSICRHLDAFDQRTLIVVPTKSLVEQMAKDFSEYGWDTDDKVHKIYQGKSLSTDKSVVISTWQSIYSLDKKWYRQFDCVIADECHQYKAKALQGIMKKCTDVKRRYGFTGTLDGKHVHKLTLEGLFGPVYKTTTTSDLMEKGLLAKLKVEIVTLKHPHKSFDNYNEEIEYLCDLESRNRFIHNLANKLKGNVLLLFTRVEGHGVPLAEMIVQNTDKKVHLIHGNIDVGDREKVRQDVESSTNNIILGSYGTMSTGVNIKNIQHIIFASPSKSRTRVLQSIGRGLRKKHINNKCMLYDIADDMRRNGGKPNYTLNHLQERIKFYIDENFDYRITEISL